ncbi:MAG: hypothetical protein U0840_02670 [Gemmataceae bacterium]
MNSGWWVPGFLVGVVGVAALVGGAISGGPDVVGGVVFGVVALAASGVMLYRRSSEAWKANAEGQGKPGAVPVDRS